MADIFSAFLGQLVDSVSRLHWLFVASAIAVSALVWLYERRNRLHRLSLLGFLFPKSVWLHPSAKLDYIFVFIDRIMVSLVVIAVAVLSGKALAGDISQAEITPTGVALLYTAAIFIIGDLAHYWAHRWMHTVPVLWQFHKVHHSCEVLTPFSNYRQHPVEYIFKAVIKGIAIGAVTLLIWAIYPEKLTAMAILGGNAGRFLFNIVGSNLRHSHVWFSYGPVLNRVFVSPAMHQLHHSCEDRHLDINYGFTFAIWDWMFGSIYVPRAREKMTLGLYNGESAQFRSIKDLYLLPFKKARVILAERFPKLLNSA